MEEKISDRINSRSEKSFLYHNNLAVFFKHKGFFSKALKEYEKALRKKPDFANGYYNLGVLYYEMGKYDKAREKWETVLRIDPNNRFVKESLQQTINPYNTNKQ